MSTGDQAVDAHIARLADAAPPLTADQDALISGLMNRAAQRLMRDAAATRDVGSRIPVRSAA